MNERKTQKRDNSRQTLIIVCAVAVVAMNLPN